MGNIFMEKDLSVIDRGCYERGCACFNPQVDTDGVVVLMERIVESVKNEFNTTRADDMQVGGSHYKDLDPQPWDVMEALLTPEEFRGFLKGNMIKYAMRQGKKDSPDAGKYHHYKKKLREITGDETWI